MILLNCSVHFFHTRQPLGGLFIRKRIARVESETSLIISCMMTHLAEETLSVVHMAGKSVQKTGSRNSVVLIGLQFIRFCCRPNAQLPRGDQAPLVRPSAVLQTSHTRALCSLKVKPCREQRVSIADSPPAVFAHFTDQWFLYFNTLLLYSSTKRYP